MSDSLPVLLFTMEPFLYLDETMQHTIQDFLEVGVADIDFSHQVAQSSTQQGDCEPVLMDKDRPVPEDQVDQSEENEDDEKDEECCEEEVSLHGCNGKWNHFTMSLCSILSRIAVMWEWQTLVTMVTIVVKWHRAVLSKEIVCQC